MKFKITNSREYDLDKFRRKAARSYSRKIFAIRFLPLLVICYLQVPWYLMLILLAAWYLIGLMFFDHKHIYTFRPVINIWFGVPGSGKTSMAALLTRHSINSGYKVLSNVNIDGAYVLEPTDLGKYDMSFEDDGCHVVYDEGNQDFDNRNYKNFAKTDLPKYFSVHRHMNNRVDVFSQGYDVDKRIRDRAAQNGLFFLKKINIPGFVMYRRISRVLTINKEDKQLVDGFEFKGLPRILYSRGVWKSFDTLDKSICPKDKKEWKLWNNEEDAA